MFQLILGPIHPVVYEIAPYNDLSMDELKVNYFAPKW